MTEQSKSFVNDWWEMQEKLVASWKDSFDYLRPDKLTELYEKHAETMKTYTWPGSEQFRFYQDWFKQSVETMQEFTRKAPSGVGPEAMDKLLRATEVYTKLLTFWQDFAAGMPGREDPQRWQQFSRSMMENYNKVLEAFFMANLPDAVKTLVRSPLEVGGLYKQAIVNLLQPWLETSPVLQEKLQKTLLGDRQAYMEFINAWTEAYQESTGKFLRMPALGLSRDNIEKILGSLDSFNKLVLSVGNFSAVMHQVGYEAMEKLMQSIAEHSQKGAAPESLKGFYGAWWQANEEAYFKLFKTESFARILSEMVDAAVTFKKNYDDLLTDIIASSLPVVTNREMDTLAKAVYDLKKSQKEQASKIKELSKAVESLKEKGKEE